MAMVNIAWKLNELIFRYVKEGIRLDLRIVLSGGKADSNSHILTIPQRNTILPLFSIFWQDNYCLANILELTVRTFLSVILLHLQLPPTHLLPHVKSVIIRPVHRVFSEFSDIRVVYLVKSQGPDSLAKLQIVICIIFEYSTSEIKVYFIVIALSLIRWNIKIQNLPRDLLKNTFFYYLRVNQVYMNGMTYLRVKQKPYEIPILSGAYLNIIWSAYSLFHYSPVYSHIRNSVSHQSFESSSSDAHSTSLRTLVETFLALFGDLPQVVKLYSFNLFILIREVELILSVGSLFLEVESFVNQRI